MTTTAVGVRIVAHDVTIRRGQETIIEGLTWDHEPGTIAWLNGPNGAGKSSLMRVLALIDRPHAGAVTHQIDGGMAGREHVASYTPAMSLPPEPKAAWFAALTRKLVDRPLPLEPDRALGRKPCRALSTGEEKRLLLGPIVARARPFVFLDEPYEHLSREARDELTAHLVELARTSVVVVATNQPIPAHASGPTIMLSMQEAPHVVRA
jgi:ABC-type transport system involved in cytochrome c biogenesis ATPase subunit